MSSKPLPLVPASRPGRSVAAHIVDSATRAIHVDQTRFSFSRERLLPFAPVPSRPAAPRPGLIVHKKLASPVVVGQQYLPQLVVLVVDTVTTTRLIFPPTGSRGTAARVDSGHRAVVGHGAPKMPWFDSGTTRSMVVDHHNPLVVLPCFLRLQQFGAPLAIDEAESEQCIIRYMKNTRVPQKRLGKNE
jgi:hypothetical protein